jgi:hypothetical protein
MNPRNTNRYRPHPDMPGVSILTITRLHCPPDGDSRGPREIVSWMDTADVAFAERHTWYAQWHRHTRSFYVSTTLRTPTGKATGQLHRMLLAPEDPSAQIDHRNGVTLDNRRSNLRLATAEENNRNRGAQRNNTSGVPGVSWHKRHQRWRVHIKVNGKQIHLGYYDARDEAIAARLAAEDKYFGEFAFSSRQQSA